MTPAELAAGRSRLGWTQERFAHALGMSQPTIGLYERGLRPIPGDIAQTVQRLLYGWCPACRKNRIVAVFWDGLAGCCTKPIPGESAHG
jgi:DNA-binding XRE family transcriptional regulator